MGPAEPEERGRRKVSLNTGDLGVRLAWARNQQGMILQQVSERSGLAIGYISQLEKGAKTNPTVSALERLAKALNVSVAFLLGEVHGPPFSDAGTMLVGGQAWTIGQRFARYLEGLSRQERDQVVQATVEQRLGRVVQFLCQHFDKIYTRAVVAYQLGISVRALNDILDRNVEVGFTVLNQMATITGIPVGFFATGDLKAPAALAQLSPNRLLRYLTAISLASELDVDPEELRGLIMAQFGTGA